MNRDVVRQHTLQPARQRDHWRHIHVPNATGEYGFRDVQMAYLMRGVHTGIGTSRNGQTERFPRIIDGHAQHGVQYALDLPPARYADQAASPNRRSRHHRMPSRFVISRIELIKGRA